MISSIDIFASDDEMGITQENLLLTIPELDARHQMAEIHQEPSTSVTMQSPQEQESEAPNISKVVDEMGRVAKYTANPLFRVSRESNTDPVPPSEPKKTTLLSRLGQRRLPIGLAKVAPVQQSFLYHFKTLYGKQLMRQARIAKHAINRTYILHQNPQYSTSFSYTLRDDYSTCRILYFDPQEGRYIIQHNSYPATRSSVDPRALTALPPNKPWNMDTKSYGNLINETAMKPHRQHIQHLQWLYKNAEEDIAAHRQCNDFLRKRLEHFRVAMNTSMAHVNRLKYQIEALQEENAKLQRLTKKCEYRKLNSMKKVTFFMDDKTPQETTPHHDNNENKPEPESEQAPEQNNDSDDDIIDDIILEYVDDDDEAQPLDLTTKNMDCD